MDERRQEIVDYLIKTKIPETCVKYQLNKTKNQFFKDEMLQEVWLFILEYDIEKLEDAYGRGSLNALITAFIKRQFFSRTSPFFKKYKKFDILTDEITGRELNIPG